MSAYIKTGGLFVLVIVLIALRIGFGGGVRSEHSNELPKRVPDRAVLDGEVSAPTFAWSRAIFSQKAVKEVTSEPSESAVVRGVPKLPRLVGVVVLGDRRVAVLDVEGRVMRLTVGSFAVGGRLVDVSARSVTLRMEGEERVLRLDGVAR